MAIILYRKIEELRLQMEEQAVLQGSLTHVNVVAISQKLDKYIVSYQKSMQ